MFILSYKALLSAEEPNEKYTALHYNFDTKVLAFAYAIVG
jgi:hypothetical protein